MQSTASTDGITVVVPTRNVEKTVEYCLASIIDQSAGGHLEVVVVDNGSSDRTLELVRLFPVVLLQLSPGFVSRSRNAGAATGHHPLLAFVDSDCIVLPGWANAIRLALRDDTLGAVGARHLLRDSPTWVELAWQQAHQRPPSIDVQEVDYLPAGNLAVRRSVFVSMGGFDETLETGEDPDLCVRISRSGLRIVEDSRIRCIHLGEPRTLTEVYRRERWHGRGLRLRYSDGRIAPIALTTIAFMLSLLVAIFAIAMTLIRPEPSLSPLYLAPAVIPVIYAARYARPPRPLHLVRLIPIYFVYFLARSTALPIVVRRLVGRQFHCVQ